MDRKIYKPWHPVQVRPDNETPADNREIRKADCVAIQAFSQGIASEDQQKRAWAALLWICGTHDMTWFPEELGGERNSSFSAGKQFVGLQLKKLSSNPLDLLTGERHERNRPTEQRDQYTTKGRKPRGR